MATRLNNEELDRILKADPARGLNIIDGRATRRLQSQDPVQRMIGRLTADAVDRARDRVTSSKRP